MGDPAPRGGSGARLGPAARDLREVLRAMVRQPDVVEVAERSQGRHRILEVAVDAADMGAVIGREGRTAAALRDLLESRGELFDETYDLKIREPREER